MISIAAIEKPACPRCNKTTIAKKGWLNDADATATVTWECPQCRTEIELDYRIQELMTDDKHRKEAQA